MFGIRLAARYNSCRLIDENSRGKVQNVRADSSGERRSFALLRPIADVSAQNRVRDLVLEAYVEHEERTCLGSKA